MIGLALMVAERGLNWDPILRCWFTGPPPSQRWVPAQMLPLPAPISWDLVRRPTSRSVTIAGIDSEATR